MVFKALKTKGFTPETLAFPGIFKSLGEPGETHIVSSPGGGFIALADFHKISL